MSPATLSVEQLRLWAGFLRASSPAFPHIRSPAPLHLFSTQKPGQCVAPHLSLSPPLLSTLVSGAAGDHSVLTHLHLSGHLKKPLHWAPCCPQSVLTGSLLLTWGLIPVICKTPETRPQFTYLPAHFLPSSRAGLSIPKVSYHRSGTLCLPAHQESPFTSRLGSAEVSLLSGTGDGVPSAQARPCPVLCTLYPHITHVNLSIL